MAVCKDCNGEMLEVAGCEGTQRLRMKLGNGVSQVYERIPYQGTRDAFRVPNERCHDCGVERGRMHHRKCDMETCPRCLGQLISCECEAPAPFKLGDAEWEQLAEWTSGDGEAA